MKLLIPLLVICNMAFSQANQVFDLISKRVGVALCEDKSYASLAKDNARHLIIAYSDEDPQNLQQTLDNIDASWYNDVDVFLGDDLDGVLSYIKTCDNAYFLEHTGKVVIDVSETQKICMVTIYCLK